MSSQEKISERVKIDGRYYGSLVVEKFTSVSETYRTAESGRSLIELAYGGNYRGAQAFYGETSERNAVHHCERGITESHMKPARDLVNQIDASFRDRAIDQWHPSLMGAYPMVGDYLAGAPDSMRIRAREENNVAPIKYYIECVVSGGTGQAELERRAAGIAALIMRTAEERPVELHALVALQRSGAGYIGTVPIETHPVDLMNTIAVFATRQYCRAVAFKLASVATDVDMMAGCDWLFGHPTQHGNSHREREFRKYLNLDPQDVVMQGGYLTDAYEFGSDPVSWVHKQIEKQRSMEDV